MTVTRGYTEDAGAQEVRLGYLDGHKTRAEVWMHERVREADGAADSGAKEKEADGEGC